MSLHRKRWRLPEQTQTESAATIVAALGIPAPVARLLCARGLRTPAEVSAFLEPPPPPDPMGLPGMPEAVRRLVRARERGERVLVYGDYDCDGVCSTALAAGALDALGLRVAVHLPDRADGYGMRAETLPALAAAAGSTLVLAVDNGCTAHEAIAAAAEAGVDVVVADHHQCDAADLPAAVAVVNPVLDPGGPFGAPAGVGVAWYVAQALAAALGQDPPEMTDLVAIGTIADVVPLLGASRWLVRRGLQVMAGPEARPGVRALLSACGVPRGAKPSARDLSHGVAPRLNAPGRIDRPHAAYDLLTARSEPEALAALAAVEDCNRRRQEMSAEVVAAAEQAAAALPSGRRALVLADAAWHPGLVGPAASKLSERFGVPVLLAGIDERGVCRGSGRGPAGWDLTGALRRCADLLVRFGGHAQAAGFETPAERLPALQAALEALAPEASGGPEPWDLDGVLAEQEWDVGVAEALEALGPFGEGNPEPAFLVRGVRAEGVRVLGREGRHLRLRLRAETGPPTGGIAFGMGVWAEGFSAGGPLDLVVRPEIDRYRGRDELQLAVLDAAPAAGDWRPFVAAARRDLGRRHPDRDRLAGAFRRLRALARQGELPAEPALLRQLDPDDEAARAALQIFQEVGLLGADGRLSLPPDGGKVDLSRSPRYRAAEAAWQALAELEGAGA